MHGHKISLNQESAVSDPDIIAPDIFQMDSATLSDRSNIYIRTGRDSLVVLG